MSALQEEIQAAESEVAAIEKEAVRAKPEAVDQLAATLATARAKLDVLRLKLAAALDAERRAAERAEAAERRRQQEAVKAAWADHRAHLLAWSEDVGELVQRLGDRWREYHGLYDERQQLRTEAQALGVEVDDSSPTPEAAAAWVLVRTRGYSDPPGALVNAVVAEYARRQRTSGGE